MSEKILTLMDEFELNKKQEGEEEESDDEPPPPPPPRNAFERFLNLF